MTVKPQIKNNWHYVLNKLFGIPSVILIGGVWKSGKTDFALLIAESLMKLNLVKEVASNIDTQNTFPMISDLLSLRVWLQSSNRRKLYIFDEANVHLLSRRAMTRKNVGLIQILGEVSKAHARMILVAQELLTIDKEFLNPTWVRGVFIKRNLKKAELISHLIHKHYIFQGIPKTTIPFDPYAIAPFTEKPQGQMLFKDKDLQILWDWSNGVSHKELGLHGMQINRLARKFIRENLLIKGSQLTHIMRRGI